jgi:hypothetical protein
MAIWSATSSVRPAAASKASRMVGGSCRGRKMRGGSFVLTGTDLTPKDGRLGNIVHRTKFQCNAPFQPSVLRNSHSLPQPRLPRPSWPLAAWWSGFALRMGAVMTRRVQPFTGWPEAIAAGGKASRGVLLPTARAVERRADGRCC